MCFSPSLFAEFSFYWLQTSTGKNSILKSFLVIRAPWKLQLQLSFAPLFGCLHFCFLFHETPFFFHMNLTWLAGTSWDGFNREFELFLIILWVLYLKTSSLRNRKRSRTTCFSLGADRICLNWNDYIQSFPWLAFYLNACRIQYLYDSLADSGVTATVIQCRHNEV